MRRPTTARRTRVRAASIGVVIVFVLFELFTIVINMDVPTKTVTGSGNVLESLGHVVGGGVGGKLMIVAVALSTIATLETTLIQVTRSLLSMAREKTLPALFGQLHSEWHTPVFATAVIAVISLILFVVSSFAHSVDNVLTDAISAIGLQIAVYYSLAGFAAVVAFRRLRLPVAVELPADVPVPAAGRRVHALHLHRVADQRITQFDRHLDRHRRDPDRGHPARSTTPGRAAPTCRRSRRSAASTSTKELPVEGIL